VRIVIVGPGAMGCLFAALLTKAKHDVWLLDHIQVRVDEIKAQGIKVEGLSGEQQIPCKQISGNPSNIGRADLLMLFVKAYNTESAINHAFPLIDKNTALLTLQNGLGNVEKIITACPGNPVIAGTTAHGATLLGTGHVRHAGIGETVIGAANNAGTSWLVMIISLFETAGIQISVTDNINGWLWGKLLINIGINPLTAIMKIKNGEILNYPHLVEVMQKCVAEGFAVAKAMGITIPYPEPTTKVLDVCRMTAENHSSMLQDIEAGRNTEIEYLNGVVVRQGAELGMQAFVNAILANLVQTFEAHECMN
jgi:2-dehydropantoate 2-reductase